jgi:hypothetical protein
MNTGYKPNKFNMNTESLKGGSGVEPPFETDYKRRMETPCSHPGCFNHISHPCENCGRIQGKTITDYTRQKKHEFIMILHSILNGGSADWLENVATSAIWFDDLMTGIPKKLCKRNNRKGKQHEHKK